MDNKIREIEKEYGAMIKYIVSGIISSEEEREECINDVYLKVWQNLDSYDSGKSKMSTWITSIARNTAVDRARKMRVNSELDENIIGGMSPEDEFIVKESVREIERLVKKFSKRNQILFWRKYYYLQSTRQIAAELGMTERSVEGKLYRIRKKLQKELGER